MSGILKFMLSAALLLQTWAAMTAAMPPQPLRFKYVGCFVDGDNSNRDLVGLLGISAFGPFATYSEAPAFVLTFNLTLEMCSQICSYGRFRYFGTEARGFCSCDSIYGSLGAAAEGDCYIPCYGNASQKCGGNSRLSIYENIFPPFTSRLMKLTDGSAPIISASPSFATHRSLTARTKVECAAACQRSQDCLACAFEQSGRLCHLMRFAAVPSAIAGVADGIWMKI